MWLPDIQGFALENVKNWFSKGYVDMFQPVNISTYALNFEISQFEPFGYHLFNLCIFIFIVLLLWRFLYLLTNDYPASLVVTLFFAIHPFAVESVAWVSGRIALMALLFMLLALNYYVSGGRNFLVLFLLYLLAVLSKITVILLPIFLLVIDLGLQNEPFSKKNLFPKMGMLVLIAPILIFSLTLREPDKSLYMWELITSIPAKYFWYLNHIIPVYDYSPIYDPPNIWDWKNLVGISFILLTGWIFGKASKENRNLMITGALIFLISLMPHMIQFSVGTPMGDRYGFISFIGIVIILAGFIKHFSKSRVATIAGITILGIISIFHGLDTYKYSSKWRSAYTLWDHAVEVVPRNSIAHSKLGSWLYTNGDYKRAREELIMAVSLDPENADSFYNLGSLSYYAKLYSEAIGHFTRVYELENNNKILIYRAQCYYGLKDYVSTIIDLDQYISNYPEAEAFLLRGQSKIKAGLDGCSDLRMALDLGMDEVLATYARECIDAQN